jgi:transcription elongation factor Elf1
MVKPAFKTKIMENNNWEPRIRQKVVSLESATNFFGKKIVKGNVYTVDVVEKCPKCGEVNVALIEIPKADVEAFCTCSNCNRHHIKIHKSYVSSTWLAPVAPSYENISKELANEAIKENIEVDVPIQEVVNKKFPVKEVVNN